MTRSHGRHLTESQKLILIQWIRDEYLMTTDKAERRRICGEMMREYDISMRTVQLLVLKASGRVSRPYEKKRILIPPAIARNT